MPTDDSPRAINAGAGFKTNNWRFSVNGAYSDTFISNQKYTSLSGTNVDLTHGRT